MSDFVSPPWEQEINPNNPTISPLQLQGLWIPSQYLYAGDIGLTEKIFMAYIRMMDQEKHCFASNEYLAKLMDTTEKRVRNMLTDLRNKGYIETLSRNPRVISCLK